MDESTRESLNFLLVAAHRLVYRGIVAELGLAPLPPASDEADDAAPDRPDQRGRTPKERVEARAEE